MEKEEKKQEKSDNNIFKPTKPKDNTKIMDFEYIRDNNTKKDKSK